MYTKNYYVRYICPECKYIFSYSQSGVKSNVFTYLPKLLSERTSPPCHICKTKGKDIQLEVLRASWHVLTAPVIKNDSDGRLRVVWKCLICSKTWSSQIPKTSIREVLDDKKNRPSCIDSECKANKKDIRSISVKHL